MLEGRTLIIEDTHIP